jgi:glycosyltransferase involved in cell wall biosynthesis
MFAVKTGLPARTVENGVDAAHFAPGAVEPAETPHPLIAFTGQMDYAPNIAAVTAFVRDVLPLLPHATFAIVGRAPTAAVRALAAPNILVTGEVADTRPWLAAADIVVAPLALARGVQNKVLEAMAMGRPVVASSAAAEGIDAEVGVELLVADSPAMQAAAIGALLTDPLHARAVGAAARDRVLARYSWDACLAPLAGLVG